MFVNPSFDPKSMSDDELMRRTQELDSKMGWLARTGGSVEALQQMQALRALIDGERRERVFAEVWAMRDPNPVMIETDPDLRQAEESPAEEEIVHVPRPRPVRRIAPTAMPMPTRTAAPRVERTAEPKKGDGA